MTPLFDKLCLLQDLVIQGTNIIFWILLWSSIIMEGRILASVTHAAHCRNRSPSLCTSCVTITVTVTLHVKLVAFYRCITQVQSSHTRSKARGKPSFLGIKMIEISVKKKKELEFSAKQDVHGCKQKHIGSSCSFSLQTRRLPLTH